MNSGSFHFTGGDDITCPSCETKWDVDWDTEYGDPCVGEHFGDCPRCGNRIEFGCYIKYTQPNNTQLRSEGGGQLDKDKQFDSQKG